MRIIVFLMITLSALRWQTGQCSHPSRNARTHTQNVLKNRNIHKKDWSQVLHIAGQELQYIFCWAFCWTILNSFVYLNFLSFYSNLVNFDLFVLSYPVSARFSICSTILMRKIVFFERKHYSDAGNVIPIHFCLFWSQIPFNSFKLIIFSVTIFSFRFHFEYMYYPVILSIGFVIFWYAH